MLQTRQGQPWEACAKNLSKAADIISDTWYLLDQECDLVTKGFEVCCPGSYQWTEL